MARRETGKASIEHRARRHLRNDDGELRQESAIVRPFYNAGIKRVPPWTVTPSTCPKRVNVDIRTAEQPYSTTTVGSQVT
jgi:hypothetical protein